MDDATRDDVARLSADLMSARFWLAQIVSLCVCECHALGDKAPVWCQTCSIRKVAEAALGKDRAELRGDVRNV